MLEPHNGKFGIVEWIALSVVIFTFFMAVVMIILQQNKEKVLTEVEWDVIICPVVYESYYTEIGTKEYKPVMKCEEG